MDNAPIIIDSEKCKGCKKCVKGCPFSALEMVGKKAVLVGDCRACGACIEICPFGAITASFKRGLFSAFCEVAGMDGC